MAVATRTINLDALPVFLDGIKIDPKKINYKPALMGISTLLEARAKGRFASATAPDGTPWAPLKRQRNRLKDRKAEAKRQARIKKGLKVQGGQKVLRDSDILMGSMTGEGRGKAYQVKQLFSMALRQGTNVDYGIYHQDGTKSKTKKNKDGTRAVRMVARPFAGLNEKDCDDIQEIVSITVAKAFGG